MKNENEQVFILNQQTNEIILYELKKENNLEVLCTCPGNIYDDSPREYIIYLKSKIHIIDEKNSRIIFVKYKPHLTTDPGLSLIHI